MEFCITRYFIHLHLHLHKHLHVLSIIQYFYIYIINAQISKSNVIDDMVQSNKILYKSGEKPDHCVVIKYVPYVGKYSFFKNIFLFLSIIF